MENEWSLPYGKAPAIWHCPEKDEFNKHAVFQRFILILPFHLLVCFQSDRKLLE